MRLEGALRELAAQRVGAHLEPRVVGVGELHRAVRRARDAEARRPAPVEELPICGGTVARAIGDVADVEGVFLFGGDVAHWARRGRRGMVIVVGGAFMSSSPTARPVLALLRENLLGDGAHAVELRLGEYDRCAGHDALLLVRCERRAFHLVGDALGFERGGHGLRLLVVLQGDGRLAQIAALRALICLDLFQRRIQDLAHAVEVIGVEQQGRALVELPVAAHGEGLALDLVGDIGRAQRLRDGPRQLRVVQRGRAVLLPRLGPLAHVLAQPLAQDLREHAVHPALDALADLITDIRHVTHRPFK